MKQQVDVKVQGLFDLLEVALGEENIENAELYLGKLSKYFHLFDDELKEYYQYAEEVIDLYSDYDEEIDDLYYLEPDL